MELKKHQKERVNFFIRRIMEDPDTEIFEDEEFSTDLGFDSLDCTEFLMYIELEFGVSIPDDKADSVITVKNVYELLGDYLTNKNGNK